MSKVLVNKRGEFSYPIGTKGLRDYAIKKLAEFYSGSKSSGNGEVEVILHISKKEKHHGKRIVGTLDLASLDLAPHDFCVYKVEGKSKVPAGHKIEITNWRDDGASD